MVMLAKNLFTARDEMKHDALICIGDVSIGNGDRFIFRFWEQHPLNSDHGQTMVAESNGREITQIFQLPQREKVQRLMVFFWKIRLIYLERFFL